MPNFNNEKKKSARFIWGTAILLIAGCCTPNQGVLTPATILASGPVAASNTACPTATAFVTFSQGMNPATINASTFTLTGPGASPVAAAVSYNATTNIATLTPTALLTAGVAYTGTVSTAAKTLYGISLAAPFSWTFTTAANGCNPPPSVVAITPAANSLTSCPNAVVTATFSEAMNPATINPTTFTLAPGVTGTITHNTANTVFTLTPSALLAAGTTYTATITTGAQDTFTNFLPAPFIWSFTTAANGCNPPPAVLAVTPLAGSNGACPNSVVTATFSEAMNPLTVTASTFSLAPGVIGTISHNAANTVYTLTPSANLAASTTYTATITTGVQDNFTNPLPAPYVWSFTTASNSCQPPPTVTSVTPPNLSTGNCPNKILSATFSEAMNPTTLTTSTVLLNVTGGPAVTGVVSYTAATNTVNFAPTASLALNTSYTATITTGVKDTFGNQLAAAYVWTFSTGASSCLPANPPVSVTPPSGAAGICPNTVITATYLQAMNPLTITNTTFLLNVTGGAAVTGTVTHDATNKIYTFTPTAALALSTPYTVTITTGAQDTFGNAMAANYTWAFATGASTCISATPAVINVTPAGGSVGNCLNSLVTATFNIAMNPATINTNSFIVSPGVTGTVTLDATGKVATFTPAANFAVSTTYTATINTLAQSTTGTPLPANYVWSFTTSSQACQPPVPLGTAANYVILGYSTVTNTGPTVITGGNLGLSPGTALTGFPPGTFVLPAKSDLTTPTAAQAQLDSDIAYLYMAGLPGGAALPNDLSGLTFTPGLYKNAVAVTLNSGSFTLDAQGNANAVFIFQVGSTLTTIGSTQIILANGAQAKNVFWQIGSAATLGTNSIFKGTIIALQSVTLQTGANLLGRALALNGAVTMDTNIITAP